MTISFNLQRRSAANLAPATPLGVAGSAVFLHTGWRSGGTWLWSACRAQPGVRAFYEPLHEGIGRLRRSDINQLRPGAWRSNHAETPPYFEEYRALIPAGGRGVPEYAARFAFDDFFLEPDAQDPGLEDYVASLLLAAHGSGELPVLKFCRSLGRVAWFEKRFPAALHAVVLRDPVSQFLSAQRLQQQARNRYFLVAPLLVLASNAAAPRVRAACTELGLSLPPLHSTDHAYRMETVWRHIKRLDPAERYRSFLAFWTLAALSAVGGEAALIDMARLVRSPAHLLETEALLGSRAGAGLTLVPRARAEEAPNPVPDVAAAHGAAVRLAQAVGSKLRPDRLAVVLSHLSAPDLSAKFAAAEPVARRPFWMGAQVAYARALQPARRLHGQLVKSVLF